MSLLVKKLLGGAALLVVAVIFLLLKFKPVPAPALMATALPTMSATATPSPSLLPISTPTGTITPKPTANVRLDYVQQQLVSAGFAVGLVQQLISDSRLQRYPIKVVAYKAPNWQIIKDKLYDPVFVQQGRDYIAANQTIFDNAEKDFGVPKTVLAGIIAIETEFGKNTGTTPTFNALYSRMEQWPQTKWQGQASQLVALASYCLREQRDCFALKGSYAGALGIVQFMPDSLLHYGIDGNQDGLIDLSSPADAIPSAANFLSQHSYIQDQTKAIASYYGSSIGYPEIVLHYAELLAP